MTQHIWMYSLVRHVQHQVGWIQRFSFPGPARDGHAPAQPEWHLWSLRQSCLKFGFTSGNMYIIYTYTYTWKQYLTRILRERQLTLTNPRDLLISSGQGREPFRERWNRDCIGFSSYHQTLSHQGMLLQKWKGCMSVVHHWCFSELLGFISTLLWVV